MPLSASNWARPALKFAIAPFVAAYGNNVALGLSELIELVLMIDAPGCMCGTAALHRWNIALTLTWKV